MTRAHPPTAIEKPHDSRSMRDRPAGLLAILCVVGFGLECLLIKRLAVRDASTQELRPRRDGDVGLDPFRQGPPEIRVMPAQVVSRAVAMVAYGAAEFDHFSDQLFSHHALEIVIHRISLPHSINPRRRQVCQSSIPL